MRELRNGKGRPGKSRRVVRIAAELLGAAVLCQPDLAHAAHGGGGHGGFAGLHNGFAVGHEGHWHLGWHGGRYGWWWAAPGLAWTYYDYPWWGLLSRL